MEANELLSVARQIKKLINKKMEPVLADCELKPIEVDILVFLYNHPYVDTSKEIMNIFHLSKAHISHSLDNLRENGYIRLAEDSKDHRIMHIIINLLYCMLQLTSKRLTGISQYSFLIILWNNTIRYIWFRSLWTLN